MTKGEVDATEFTKPTAQERIDAALEIVGTWGSATYRQDSVSGLTELIIDIAQILRGEK